MLNYLWAIMIIIGVVYGAITGNIQIVGNAAIDSGKEAVSLCITMLGVVSMWTGIMKIAENCGIIQAAAKAMKALGELNGGKNIASNEMCIFLVLNISSLQLIPINIIAYRSQYGSVNPAVIVAPAIAATLISTVVAIIICKIMDRG